MHVQRDIATESIRKTFQTALPRTRRTQVPSVPLQPINGLNVLDPPVLREGAGPRRDAFCRLWGTVSTARRVERRDRPVDGGRGASRAVLWQELYRSGHVADWDPGEWQLIDTALVLDPPCRWPLETRLPSSTVCLSLLSRPCTHPSTEDDARPPTPPPAQPAPPAQQPASAKRARGGPASRGGKYYARGGSRPNTDRDPPSSEDPPVPQDTKQRRRPSLSISLPSPSHPPYSRCRSQRRPRQRPWCKPWQRPHL